MNLDVLGAIRDAGPWLTVAAICILLLFGCVKVLVWDHQLVPTYLLEQERERTEKALAYFDRVTTSVDRLAASTAPVLPLVESLSREVRELRADVDELRRDSREARK